VWYQPWPGHGLSPGTVAKRLVLVAEQSALAAMESPQRVMPNLPLHTTPAIRDKAERWFCSEKNYSPHTEPSLSKIFLPIAMRSQISWHTSPTGMHWYKDRF